VLPWLNIWHQSRYFFVTCGGVVSWNCTNLGSLGNLGNLSNRGTLRIIFGKWSWGICWTNGEAWVEDIIWIDCLLDVTEFMVGIWIIEVFFPYLFLVHIKITMAGPLWYNFRIFSLILIDNIELEAPLKRLSSLERIVAFTTEQVKNDGLEVRITVCDRIQVSISESA